MNDLIGKQIDLGCEQATTATEPVKGKLVKAYAVTTKTRLASLPELPTADEAGLNGFEVNVWHGIFRAQRYACSRCPEALGSFEGRGEGPGGHDALHSRFRG
jgi:tripartite tricarboxylate transporter family receptor